MEVAVSEFVSHTGSEPGLARDILQSANWDIHAAYNIFNTLRSGPYARGLSATNKQQSHIRVDVGDRLEEDFHFPPSYLSDSSSLKESVDEEGDDDDDEDDGEEENREREGACSPSQDAPPSPVDERCIDCIKADNAVNRRAQSDQVNCWGLVDGLKSFNFILGRESMSIGHCRSFLSATEFIPTM